MYCGVKLDVSVHDYDSAYEALAERAKRAKVRGADVLDPNVRTEAGLGHRRSTVTGIRLLRDSSVACRLYNTDVVVWHPDNSVSVTTFPTITTAAFANALLPVGLNLGGESEMMTFFPGCDRASDWSERWRAAHVCNGSGTYRQVDGAWVPDADTIEPMDMIHLDRSISRAVCREYPFAAFKTGLFAACDVMDIEHQGEDYEACAEALRAGQYRRAAEHLPTVTVPRGFGIRKRLKPLRMSGVRYNSPVTLGSVEYLRRWLYKDAGIYSTTEVTTMSSAQYEQQRRLRGQLERSRVWL